jgi:hypothetical protein
MALTQVASGLIASVSGASLTGTQNIPKATLPAGSVLQVVSAVFTSTFSTTSTSDTASGLSASITPSSSNSKIFISFTGVTSTANLASYWGAFSIYRNGSTRIVGGQAGVVGTANSTFRVQSALSYLDSPATTSSTTYEIYLKSEGNSSTVSLNVTAAVVSDPKATITLMEIAA